MKDIEFFMKRGNRTKEERTVHFVVLDAVFIREFSGTNALRIIPGKNQSGNHHPNEDSQSQIVKHNRHDRHDDHDEGI